MNVKDIHYSKNLVVIIFNVGQGDHILIKFPNSTYGIIDFYYSGAQTEPPALTYFRSLQSLLKDDFVNVKLEFVHISHPHLDHITGCKKTIEFLQSNKIEIKKIILPATVASSENIDKVNQILYRIGDEDTDLIHESELFEGEYASLLEAPESYPYVPDVIRAVHFDKLSVIGEGTGKIVVKSLGPTKKYIKTVDEKEFENAVKYVLNHAHQKARQDDEGYAKVAAYKEHELDKIGENLLSSLVWIKGASGSLLFTGDIKNTVWKDAISYYDEIQYYEEFGEQQFDFIKLSHHGAKNGSDPFIWKSILKSDASANLVASAGRHSSYKHPSSETMEQVRSHNLKSPVWATNVCEKCIAHKCDRSVTADWYRDGLDLKTIPSGWLREVEMVYASKTVTKKASEDTPSDTKEGLLALMFEFDKRDPAKCSKINLMSEHAPAIPDCFFEAQKHHHKPDNCALHK